MPPIVLQLPENPVIIEESIASEQEVNGQLLYWKFEIVSGKGFFSFLGRNCTFTVTSDSPCNLGIYGPNPTQIGPPFGRMRSPKINISDAKHHKCQGNFSKGIYYLIVRQGDNNPPKSSVKIMITSQNYQAI